MKNPRTLSILGSTRLHSCCSVRAPGGGTPAIPTEPSPRSTRDVAGAVDALTWADGNEFADWEFTGPARCSGDYLSWSVGAGTGEEFKTWDVFTRWEK